MIVGAVHAHYAIVFARLIHEGVDEGLHGFLVNIRDTKDLAVKEGCQVWDMGMKIGLNGVDNAALWFNKVRIPRTNLLNATSNMDENGVFTSKVTFLSIGIGVIYYLESLLYSPILMKKKISVRKVIKRHFTYIVKLFKTTLSYKTNQTCTKQTRPVTELKL